MFLATLMAPLLVIKAPKKTVFIISGSISSLSQATSEFLIVLYYKIMHSYYALSPKSSYVYIADLQLHLNVNHP